MRNARSVLIVLLFAASALLLTSCAAPEAGRPAAAGPGAGAGPADALEACLAQIPSNASAGQRAMAEQTCRRNASARDAVVNPETAAATSRGAEGHAGDTLEACLARIPKDASAGQRMIAEDSCRKADAARKAVGVQ